MEAARNLGNKDVEAGMLVVPPELVTAVFCTQGLAIVLNVLEECVILGGSPQPCCPPQQLILPRISVCFKTSA